MQSSKRAFKLEVINQVKNIDSSKLCQEETSDSTVIATANHREGPSCQCELCQARLYVSMKNSVEEEFCHYIQQSHNMGDGFHLPIPGPSCPPAYHLPYPPQPFATHFQYAYIGEIPTTSCSAQGQCPCNYHETSGNDESCFANNIFHRMPTSPNSDTSKGHASHTTYPVMPQVYASKEGIIHVRLSPYVALELSGSAYRLINYRNNSAIALNDSGEYGFVYHYNCRGVINMHHEKISIAFDRDRQILLRRERSSFVRKENECYRLASRHWNLCKPVSMESFDKDKTPDVLKKASYQRQPMDDTKLKDIVNSAVMHSETPLTVYIGDAKIEQRVNGDFQLGWFFEDRSNCMIISPLAGTFSLSTKNLEMITTAKSDIYISFVEFFVHVGSQQLTVSKGSIYNLHDIEGGGSSILSLNSSLLDETNKPSHFFPNENVDCKIFDREVSDTDLLSDSES